MDQAILAISLVFLVISYYIWFSHGSLVAAWYKREVAQAKKMVAGSKSGTVCFVCKINSGTRVVRYGHRNTPIYLCNHCKPPESISKFSSNITMGNAASG